MASQTNIRHSPPAAPPRIPNTSNAYVTIFRLILAPWTVNFKTPNYVRESTMDMLSQQCRRLSESTVKDAEVRSTLGASPAVWEDVRDLFVAAIPSLEQRCFLAHHSADQSYVGPSGEQIARNHVGLMKDLERLNDVMQIARNLCAAGEIAQDTAANAQFDQQVFSLITVCVRITARGYDGVAGSEDEMDWQRVVNAYKKLLITSLQFLNNLVAANERRKLMLWVELFEGNLDGLTQPYGDEPTSFPVWPSVEQRSEAPLLGATSALLTASSRLGAAIPLNLSEEQEAEVEQRLDELSINEEKPTGDLQGKSEREVMMERPVRPLAAYFYFVKDVRGRDTASRDPKVLRKLIDESAARWRVMSAEEKRPYQELYQQALHEYREALASWKTKYGVVNSISSDDATDRTADVLVARSSDASNPGLSLPPLHVSRPLGSPFNNQGLPISEPLFTFNKDNTANKLNIPDRSIASLAEETDFRVTCSAAAGAQVLEDGKEQLMKRLSAPISQDATCVPSAISPLDPASGNAVAPLECSIARLEEELDETIPEDQLDDEEIEESGEEEEEEEEEESDDEEYAIPGEEGRGLLTDVPLILGPNEIEVLPMIVMSSIVPPPVPSIPGYGSTSDEVNAIMNMHTVRCHLLLAQENGRNLLRELLIFVAAWDLREDELYFKFMVKIMEAVLLNGLMPYAYHAFRESKDIISPAQAVILKLLTNIFRQRQSLQQRQENLKTGGLKPIQPPAREYPAKVDVHIVSYLFTEFRQNIIPQTCALIFLQGQIRKGLAQPEDFPLNLWDMERMYEGVYQYLEFFAILTEHDTWKRMMSDWAISSELVTLLRELDTAIPKGALPSLQPGPRRNPPAQAPPVPAAASQLAPQDSDADNATSDPQAAPVAVERPYDTTSPTTSIPAPPASYPATPYPPSPQDEPSDFEWRNLKKLAVLVLSSLVWKCRIVQDQVRSYGGITAILNCCAHDEHNPYIREHAIMCLRFLMEGNEENQREIRDLEAKSVVPSEVLDGNGYETFMDSRGQVGLKRKGEDVPGVREMARAGNGSGGRR